MGASHSLARDRCSCPPPRGLGIGLPPSWTPPSDSPLAFPDLRSEVTMPAGSAVHPGVAARPAGRELNLPRRPRLRTRPRFDAARVLAGKTATPGTRRIAPGHERVHRQRGLRRSEEHTSELQSRLHLVCRL